jgi:hypothetical protein
MVAAGKKKARGIRGLSGELLGLACVALACRFFGRSALIEATDGRKP